METKTTTALVVLRAEECRSLIGQAVAHLPQVIRAAGRGRMVIVGGATNRHVVRHLLKEDPGVAAFAMGWIQGGALGETPPEGRGPGPYLLERGRLSRGWPGPLLEKFEAGDIYIKGANAIDHNGHTAILLGSPLGGSIGLALPLLHARGGELIVPVSLEKMIPSIPATGGLLGQGRVERVMGTPVGIMPIPAGTATVVTEVTAFKTLFGVTATPVAAGGLAECAGALTLHLQGPIPQVDAAWNGVQAIRKNI
ncbi:MAG: hypothetical protein HQL52_03115 [Magnetococcales bacterium]|nr:hypothetical protein [Magnetococcales bacterium]